MSEPIPPTPKTKKPFYRYFKFLATLLLFLVPLIFSISMSKTKEQQPQQHQQVFTNKNIVNEDIARIATTDDARTILKYFIPDEQSEGVGARVRRAIGTNEMPRFPPFLMLDHFKVTPPEQGFPDHPHHGQETITYILDGMIAHEDFTGSKGVLRPGDLQFMTAGKGIVHSEMPVLMKDGRPGIGLQLWVDLPRELKNCEPRYRNLRKNEIPIVHTDDEKHMTVKVISGNAYGVDSVRDLAYTPIHFYHYISDKAGVEFKQSVPDDFNVFLYVMKGAVVIDDQIFKQNTAVFFNVDGHSIKGQSATNDTEFAIIGGKILDQPLVQHGPFVETTREDLYKVFENYQQGINGFERAVNWRSSIADGIDEDTANALLN
ncbi:pirin family protein NDAI_0D00830 [Naumovozyma dairenensis CBS 421]|uniref:Pirin-like protein n=1 Tax=Naumovozyma dairenensis (strain ATCC 10597 / BCRC 20456 / CBS 421 / NBRC 0211 / NRRL Y-12639) TaxID=1071378 RepID=G0W9D6_NAUDC|nr:hypothetical protein NDAI_0D00830 [Naumovozyma dairenensis CBS 421]CCD24397.1 hypothetical protein NDAI_0D00830 [Naumovozyma dairenensis CBS 421]